MPVQTQHHERKRNEGELGAMMRALGYNVRKSRDKGYPACPKCHRPITRCPHCRGDTLMPKAERLADFQISRNWFDVEGKEASDGGTRFAFSDISPTQRDVLAHSAESYLFLLIGPGRAPEGRQAFLIPWKVFAKVEGELSTRDPAVLSVVFTESERKGARSPSARRTFGEYELTWFKGGWMIPPGHCFWVTTQLRTNPNLPADPQPNPSARRFDDFPDPPNF